MKTGFGHSEGEPREVRGMGNKKGLKPKFQPSEMVGDDGLEPPTLSV